MLFSRLNWEDPSFKHAWLFVVHHRHGILAGPLFKPCAVRAAKLFSPQDGMLRLTSKAVEAHGMLTKQHLPEIFTLY